MEEEKVLDNPTVKQLIDLLSTYPHDSKILISDPDTGWDIPIIHIDKVDNKVYLTGEYYEMTHD